MPIALSQPQALSCWTDNTTGALRRCSDDATQTSLFVEKPKSQGADLESVFLQLRDGLNRRYGFKKTYIGSQIMSSLRDLGLVHSRPMAAQTLKQFVTNGLIKQIDGSSSSQGSSCGFYILTEASESENLNNNEVFMDRRSRTSQCNNCNKKYLVMLSPHQGFCGVDCRTNAAIRKADAQRFQSIYG